MARPQHARNTTIRRIGNFDSRRMKEDDLAIIGDRQREREHHLTTLHFRSNFFSPFLIFCPIGEILRRKLCLVPRTEREKARKRKSERVRESA